METLPKDMLYSIAMKLELPELLKWCISDKRILNKVCEDENVWENKLKKDYPDYQKFNSENFSISSLSPKEQYVFLYQLSWIKKILKANGSEYNIFLMKKLHLSSKGLTKVPAFNLPNLQDLLYLSGNQLTEVPAFNLPNLQALALGHNNIREISPFNLPNLQILDLSINKLTKVPAFNLPNLKHLDLRANELTEVPSFNLPKLQELYLNYNKLTEVPPFNFPDLEELSLGNNKLTEETKKELQRKYGDKVSL